MLHSFFMEISMFSILTHAWVSEGQSWSQTLEMFASTHVLTTPGVLKWSDCVPPGKLSNVWKHFYLLRLGCMLLASGE